MNKILSRLQKVKKSGPASWMARCPSHDDKTASLVITDAGDGKVLLNCFAGCDTHSILQSIGMDWDDVMPEKAIGHRISPTKPVIYATEAIGLIRQECQIVLLCAMYYRKGKHVTDDDWERVLLAMERINKALELTKNE